jgi:hypothetical protein
MRLLLYNTFFDPKVYYNLVSPWLELAFKTIDLIIKRSNYKTLAIVIKQKQLTLAVL